MQKTTFVRIMGLSRQLSQVCQLMQWCVFNNWWLLFSSSLCPFLDTCLIQHTCTHTLISGNKFDPTHIHPHPHRDKYTHPHTWLSGRAGCWIPGFLHWHIQSQKWQHFKYIAFQHTCTFILQSNSKAQFSNYQHEWWAIMFKCKKATTKTDKEWFERIMVLRLFSWSNVSLKCSSPCIHQTKLIRCLVLVGGSWGGGGVIPKTSYGIETHPQGFIMYTPFCSNFTKTSVPWTCPSDRKLAENNRSTTCYAWPLQWMTLPRLCD